MINHIGLHLKCDKYIWNINETGSELYERPNGKAYQ